MQLFDTATFAKDHRFTLFVHVLVANATIVSSLHRQSYPTKSFTLLTKKWKLQIEDVQTKEVIRS